MCWRMMAAGAFAMMKVLDRGMMEGDLVTLSSDALQDLGTELNMSGVAASLFGGFIVASSYKKTLTIAKIMTPDIHIALVMPKVNAKLEMFHKVVPAQLHQHEAASNVGRAALIIHALHKGDMKTVCHNLADQVAFPERMKLIPGFKEVKGAGEGAGALGVSISGTGPAVFGICMTEDAAKDALKAMIGAFKDNQVESEGFVTRPGHGAMVIE